MPKKYEGGEERPSPKKMPAKAAKAVFQRENWMLREPFGKALIHRELDAGDKPLRKKKRTFKYDPSQEGQN